MDAAQATETAADDDQFRHWRQAIETGRGVETQPGTPRSGYYRNRNEAVAFWVEADGELCCWRSGEYAAPTKPDAIDEFFGFCAPYPVTYEAFKHFGDNGRWPDEVAPVDVPPELTPAEAAAHELAEQQKAAKAWLLNLKDAEGKNRKPQTQEEADKAGNFADLFQKIEKKATNSHKAEKDPILEAGRAIDAKWFATRDAAVIAKKWARGLSDEYVKAEHARRNEEARVANEKAQREFAAAKAKADEQAKRDAELAAKGVVVPQAAPPIAAPKSIVAEPVKIGTTGRRQSLRTVESYEIDDAGALLTFLAARNSKSEKLLAAALSDGRELQAGGVAVPGLKLVRKEEIR